MALRNIVVEGDEILRKRSREVAEVDDRTRMILDDMLETMHNGEGVGIAGPQVGILRRMFIVEAEEGNPIVFVNPKILEKSGSQSGEEGCLSVPGYYGTVERPEKLKVSALDRAGNPFELEAEGFLAVVISHEYDHLEGILFIDKAVDIHETVCDEE